MSTVLGKSKFIEGLGPNGESKFLAQAEHLPFYPAPVSILQCCVSDDVRKRAYTRAYDSYYEYNFPMSPCCFSVGEGCVMDNVGKVYYDGMLFRSNDCSKCCGPPVLFPMTPKYKICFGVCWEVDFTAYCGQSIAVAPCSCCGLRTCLFYGPKCYVSSGIPIIRGLKDPEPFLASLSTALHNYGSRNGITDAMAICENREGIAVIEPLKDGASCVELNQMP
jgi:hypothetical protein